jgi:hypothetical protein
VQKKLYPWQEDPKLRKYLNKKVTIRGILGLSGIDYRNLAPYRPKPAAKGPRLTVELKLDPATLTVNQSGSAPQQQSLALTLRVKWPYRSIWHGTCPTTQTYDFFIEHKGATIWRWSAGRFFGHIVTPIAISGGSFHEFTETWTFDPKSIRSAGVYTARSIFIASGQEAAVDFKVKIIT